MIQPLLGVTNEYIQRIWDVQNLVRLDPLHRNKGFAEIMIGGGRQQSISASQAPAAIQDNAEPLAQPVLRASERPKLLQPTASFPAPTTVTMCGRVLEPSVYLNPYKLTENTHFPLFMDFYNEPQYQTLTTKSSAEI